MLYRKIERTIYEHLKSDDSKIMLVRGARQVGKSYIIRHVGKQLFKHVVEINFIEDSIGDRIFENVRTTDDFYFTVSTIAGNQLNTKADTLIFLDEIQAYPQLLTLLKFLREEGRYSYIASGSMLGLALKQTVSIPLGSIMIVDMYPLDFSEFLIANGVDDSAIATMQNLFKKEKGLPTAMHEKILSLFKKYLITGGMPDAVNEYLATKNVAKIRKIQHDIHSLYIEDASQYDAKNKLNITRIYNLVPSSLENTKKRIVFKDIEGKKGSRSADYDEDIEYLISSGITLEVKAISNPKFPLIESEAKNLLKLYLNDVGILTSILYRTNARAILDDETSVNLGSVYENVVAQQLVALGHRLFYYDNRSHGEVDFLIDDYSNLTVAPIEVKSGKDYKRHSALSRFVSTEDYHITRGYVLSNSGTVERDGNILYLPIYYSMFLSPDSPDENELLL